MIYTADKNRFFHSDWAKKESYNIRGFTLSDPLFGSTVIVEAPTNPSSPGSGGIYNFTFSPNSEKGSVYCCDPQIIYFYFMVPSVDDTYILTYKGEKYDIDPSDYLELEINTILYQFIGNNFTVNLDSSSWVPIEKKLRVLRIEIDYSAQQYYMMLLDKYDSAFRAIYIDKSKIIPYYPLNGAYQFAIEMVPDNGEKITITAQ